MLCTKEHGFHDAWEAGPVLCGKGVLDPIEFYLSANTGYADGVEAAGPVEKFWRSTQEMCRGANDTLLLGCRDRFERIAESIVITVTNFDENDKFSVCHNQVYFARATTVVAAERAQPICIEVGFGTSFKLRTNRAWQQTLENGSRFH